MTLFEKKINYTHTHTNLPSFYKDCISSITIDHDRDDKFIWSGFPNGVYSASYGYRWLNLASIQQDAPSTSWSWIWRLPIAENLRHFCWLVMHGCLPTKRFPSSYH
jgi:hypothetical protein